jgi:hypothetical protein
MFLKKRVKHETVKKSFLNMFSSAMFRKIMNVYNRKFNICVSLLTFETSLAAMKCNYTAVKILIVRMEWVIEITRTFSEPYPYERVVDSEGE